MPKKLFHKHDKLIGEIHAKIIEFGLKLQIGEPLRVRQCWL